MNFLPSFSSGSQNRENLGKNVREGGERGAGPKINRPGLSIFFSKEEEEGEDEPELTPVVISSHPPPGSVTPTNNRFGSQTKRLEVELTLPPSPPSLLVAVAETSLQTVECRAPP